MMKVDLQGRNAMTVIAATATAVCMLSATIANAAPGAGSSLPQQSQPQVDPQQSYAEGVAALEAGDYKTAEKRFGEVLSVARNNVEANYYMGLAKVGRDKHKASIRYFERAIKERPGFVEAREQAALALVVIEKQEKAGEQLAALNEIKNNCTQETCDADYLERTEIAIAKVEAALGGNDVSLTPRALPQFAKLGSDAGEVKYTDAVRLINQDRFADAIDDLYQAQAIVGPHPDILNYLGYSHRKLGQFEKAQGYYAAALDLDPTHLGATEYLGELYLEIGDTRKAKKQLAKLDQLCAFGCAEREDLARLIDVKESIRSAGR